MIAQRTDAFTCTRLQKYNQCRRLTLQYGTIPCFDYVYNTDLYLLYLTSFSISVRDLSYVILFGQNIRSMITVGSILSLN